uniref:Hydroxyproline O-arabinosyltransferase-like domain-containing protein n=1 Tax=Chlamydomonas euryale TaxID=1486919 RepID=A0A7R9V813_9CHLO|mmetsp:Transcript_24011/g.71223  ORF Transcript_24011/g.71223 Transcript_24011/m.71223 type:complete len:572 (+) Transcript_24011:182-1897(+)
MVRITRGVVIAFGLTAIATFYSLSELHRISAAHLQADGSGFADSTDQAAKAGRKAAAVRSTLIQADPQPQQQEAAGQQTTGQQAGGQQAGRQQEVGQQRQAAPIAAATLVDRTKCFTYEHTELWGDVLAWGGSHKKASAAACCEACRSYTPLAEVDPSDAAAYPCNVWVWNGNPSSEHYQECWLKHLAHPEAAKPASEGAQVEWTAGTVGVDIKANPGVDDGSKPLRPFHTVTSAQGSATHWQMRIHYYHFKKQRHACRERGRCEMGGFTRLLHSGVADDLMDEIPTMVVDPLPSDAVEHSWYVVLNRPYAFVQWVKKQNIPEKYVLMSEPDHVFIRPLPNFMLSDDPAAFPFFYIEPGSPKNAPLTQKFTGKLTATQRDEIAPIGNSPTFMTLKDMAMVMPLWMNTSIDIFKDKDASKEWGWVQEMYGFCIGLWLGGIKHVDLYLHMMSQPPWDDKLMFSDGKPFHIIHYTYGMDFNLKGEFTPGKFGQWRYDKRAYSSRPMPRSLPDPPEGCKNELVRALIAAFNEATDAIPCWDEYQKTGKLPAKGECLEPKKGFLALEEQLGESAML